MRTIRGVATAAALAAAVSGCSVYDDLTTSDFAKQDGEAIVAAAGEAMQDVTSLRVTGQVRDAVEQYFVDLTVDRTIGAPGPCGSAAATSTSAASATGRGSRARPARSTASEAARSPGARSSA